MINSLKVLKDLLNTLTDEDLKDGKVFVEATVVTEEGDQSHWACAEEFCLDKHKDLKIIVELD